MSPPSYAAKRQPGEALNWVQAGSLPPLPLRPGPKPPGIMRTATGLLCRPGPPFRRIALLRASRVGDFLCATPALRALKHALPRAEFTLVALPTLRPLAERCPYLDHFEEFPGWPGIAEQFFDPRRATAFFQRLQQRRFDLTIQMHGSGAYSNPFALLLGARATAGFLRQNEPNPGLDAALDYPEGRHEIHKLLALAEFLGAPACGEAMELPLSDDELSRALEPLHGCPKPWIGLMPEARDEAKRWPACQFAETATRLRAQFGGTVILLGDGSGPDLPCPDALRLAGKQTLLEMAATIHHLSLLITNDSAPAHIAYARRTPSVTLFVATRPEEWGPLGGGPHRVAAGPNATPHRVVELAQEVLRCSTTACPA